MQRWRGTAGQSALLDGLVVRGLRTPDLLIIDGAPGLEKALAAGDAMARWLFNETDAEAAEEANNVTRKLELAASRLEENGEVEGNSELVEEALAITLQVIAAANKTGAV